MEDNHNILLSYNVPLLEYGDGEALLVVVKDDPGGHQEGEGEGEELHQPAQRLDTSWVLVAYSQ